MKTKRCMVRVGRVAAHSRLASLVALGLGLAGLASAPVAVAGEYHVYSCRTPSGEVAPARRPERGGGLR